LTWARSAATIFVRCWLNGHILVVLAGGPGHARRCGVGIVVEALQYGAVEHGCVATFTIGAGFASFTRGIGRGGARDAHVGAWFA